MKQKLIAALVTSAIAGFAATTAQAGVIQASYKNFAAEAFGTDVELTAPILAYNVSRPLSGTSGNPNQFTVQLKLSSGTWNQVPTVVLKDPSSANELAATGVVGAGSDTLVATFLVNNGVTYPVNSTITFGETTAATVKGVSDTLKTPLSLASACGTAAPAQISATIKLINNAGAEFDTIDAGSQVTTPILQSNVALIASVVSSDSADYDVVASKVEASKVDVLDPSLGTLFTNPVDVSSTITAPTKSIVLGRVKVKDRNDLFDVGGQYKYSVANIAPAGVWGDTAAATGGVSAAGLALKVSGNYAAGATLKLVSAASGDATTTYETATIANGVATFAAAAAGASTWAINANKEREAFIVYTVPGTAGKLIPTSQFAVTEGSLTKAAASNELANPVCVGNLYNLTSNGVQLDVRNYIHGAEKATSGWQSVIRVINTDEQQAADVYAQIIDEDGNLLANGKIFSQLPARGAKYIGTDAIEAKLTGTLPTAGNRNNARLRITSANSSLRVQNYHVNPVTGAVTEVSSAQGDEGYNTGSAPETRIYTSK
jgi:hypothetical protein